MDTIYWIITGILIALVVVSILLVWNRWNCLSKAWEEDNYIISNKAEI